jgi:hypothetical protein
MHGTAKSGGRAAVRVAAAVLVAILSGCATSGQRPGIDYRGWAMRSLGGLAGYALHEACHLALGAIFGANIRSRWGSRGLVLGFDDLSDSEHRAVAFVGNACTGLAAEIIVDTGSHKRSDFLQGVAAFHAINVFGYAFSKHGDSEYFRNHGGSSTVWKTVNAAHASRIGAQLVWDAGLRERIVDSSQTRKIPPAAPPGQASEADTWEPPAGGKIEADAGEPRAWDE